MQLNTVKMIIGEPQEGSLMICEEHHLRMIELIDEFGAGDAIAQTDAAVDLLLSQGKSDPILDISRVLFTIALNAIGSEDLSKFRCPVCAFQKFDFLSKAAGLVAIKYRDDRIITPGQPQLILTS